MNPNGLFFSNEAAQLGQADAGSQAELEMHQGAQEIIDNAAQVAVQEAQLQQAVADVGAIETQAQIVQNQVNQGKGLDQAGAQDVQAAVEHALLSLGVPADKNVCVSFENHKGGAADFNASSHTAEGLWEQVKQFWETLKAKFKAFMTKITDFFAKFFDNTEKVKKQIGELRKKYAERANWKTASGDIDYGSAAKTLMAKGKFTAQGAGDILINQKVLTDSVTNVYGTLDEVAKGMSEIIKAKGDLKDSFFEKIEKVGEEMLGKAMSYKKGVKGTVTTYTGGPFINGTSGVFEKDSKELTFSFLLVENETENKVTTAPALKNENIETLLDLSEKLMDATEGYKKDLPRIKTLNTAITQLIEGALTVASNASKDDSKTTELPNTMTKIKKGSTDLVSVVSRVTVMLPSWNVSAARAALSTVSTSLNKREDNTEK